MGLLEKFKHFIQKEDLFHLQDRLLLAVSGGVDSVVLCELCKQAGYQFAIAHCNFQLRGEESERDEAFVAQLAQQYNVSFYVKKFDTTTFAKANHQSIEAAARNLRYEWFYTFIDNEIITEIGGIATPTYDYILTAHHADDNIETVMMNFFRGTGITGLRGILPKQSKTIRPLLFALRQELELFIKENDLHFVTDHTNAENNYTRNYFRNTIIPMVNKSFPEAANNVLKNIKRFKETEILFQQAVQLHKNKLVEQKGEEVHIPILKLLKTVPLSTVLYEIIKAYNFTAHQTEEAILLLHSESGKFIKSASHRIIKNRNWLIISPNQTIVADNILIEEKDHQIIFKNGTIIIDKKTLNDFKLINDPLVAQIDIDQIHFPLLLRKWKQGDYFYPLGMQKKKKISRFFTDQKLSITQKENTWVIEMDKKIIWIVGMRIDDRFKITHATKNICCINLLTGARN